MDGLKHVPEKSILRKPLGLDHDQTPSPKVSRRPTQKPCFEDRTKATFIVDETDPSLSPTEVIEPLHEDDSERRGVENSQSRRRNWLRQAISVDGERVPGKLLHQCSLDHGYIERGSSIDDESTSQTEEPVDANENDLEDLQSQRALVEAELRRQAKAPPGLKIRDLLACRSIMEDLDDEDDNSEEEKHAKARAPWAEESRRGGPKK